jgi:cell division septum initiation protein DivIVA
MIASAVGWLESLEPSEDIDVVFDDYDQFSDMVLDVAEDIAELEYEVEYDPNAFNSISIQEVFE